MTQGTVNFQIKSQGEKTSPACQYLYKNMKEGMIVLSSLSLFWAFHAVIVEFQGKTKYGNW